VSHGNAALTPRARLRLARLIVEDLDAYITPSSSACSRSAESSQRHSASPWWRESRGAHDYG